MQVMSLSHRYSCRWIVERCRLWRTVSNFQLYLTRIAHESFSRHLPYMVTSKTWISKWWPRHTNNASIAWIVISGDCIRHADYGEQCQTFNYSSPESPTNHFPVILPYMVTSKTWIRKWWPRHANHVSIASVFMQMDCIRRRLWRTVSNFQFYLTRIAHESFFRHLPYMVTSKT